MPVQAYSIVYYVRRDDEVLVTEVIDTSFQEKLLH